MINRDGPTGTYRPCRVCAAPIVAPFPADWELDMIKEGPSSGPVRTFYTPHRPGCAAPYADPQPGYAMRVPGRFVKGLSFLPALPNAVTSTVEDRGGAVLRDYETPVAPSRRDFRAAAQHEAERIQPLVDLTGYTFIGHTSDDGRVWAKPIGESGE